MNKAAGELQTIDRTVLTKFLEYIEPHGRRDFLVEIRASFLKNATLQVERLGAAVQAKDLGAIVEGAHLLKSSSGVVGTLKLTALCAELEELAQHKGSADACTECAGRLTSEFTRAAVALEDLIQEMLG